MAGLIGAILPAILSLGKSIASSLVCNWYKNNSVLRYEVGMSSYNTETHVLMHADSQLTVQHMKWFLNVQGAPYSTNDAFPDGRQPTIIAVILILQKYRAPVGHLQLYTYDEVGEGAEDAPMYSQKDDVIIGNFFRLYGFDDEFIIEGGFKNQSYPGPITMQPRDEIQVKAIASDNYADPMRTLSSVKGYITGTLTWDIHKPAEASGGMGISENA